MKKLCLAVTAAFAFVLVVNSSPLMAQTADGGAKTDQELARENAALRKQVDRLQLELRNAKLREQVQSLQAEKDKLAVAPTNTMSAVEATANQSTQAWTGSAAAISPAAASTYAADMPVKAQPIPAIKNEGGFYFRGDGSYQNVRLPSFSLGVKPFFLPNSYGSPLITIDPHASGFGTAEALGYRFADGTFSSLFGSSVRIELGGSYVRADGSQSSAATNVVGAAGAAPQLVNGVTGLVPVCPAPTCTTTASLSSNYVAWQVNLRTAGDFKYGATTLTPSLAVFGGNSRNDQSFAQLFGNNAGNSGVYNANTSLDWSDWGAKIGANAKFDLTDWVAVGIGGNIGIAHRAILLSANDTYTLNLLAPASSSMGANAITTPFLANAEASLIFKPYASVAIRTFAGVNYDNRVPGISAPICAVGCLAGTQATPATIKSSSETSYYVGGGLTIGFGTPLRGIY